MKLFFLYVFALVLLPGLVRNASATPATTYSVDEHNTQQQTGPSSFVVGYPIFNYEQFAVFAKIDTDGASLTAAPIFGLPAPTSTYPSGSLTFPTGINFSPNHPTGSGYSRYQTSGAETTAAQVNADFGSGAFTFTMGDATLMPTLSLDTANPVFPVQPTLTSGGTWYGTNSILVNPSADATLNFNTSAFTGYSTGMGGIISYQIYNSILAPITPPTKAQNIPALSLSDPALSSYTIPAGTLTPGQTYGLEVDYLQIVNENLTPFTGTGIAGTPFGASFYQARTMITIITDPFNGTAQGTGLYKSPWFGYYSNASYPLVYEYNLGYEYVFPSGSGMYFYDYGSGHFWYTQSSYFPFVYDFSLNCYLYYFSGNGSPRYFYSYGTDQVISL